MIRVAIGSAKVMGLSDIRMDTKPTTAHLMTPGRCVFDCKFCTQAASSEADEKLLSRISWPLFDEDKVYSALNANQGEFKRVCLQVVHSEAREGYLFYVRRIREACNLPLSVDVKAENMDSVRKTFDAGADVVGLPMDVAHPELYTEIKNGSFTEHLDLIKQAAHEFRGKISTHLIIGLGETERQAVDFIADMYAIDVTVALFAFTPVRGTKLASGQQPSFGQYRRTQLARFLIVEGYRPEFSYNEKGQISGYGYTVEELMDIMGPETFQTSGCPDCNRPYYNERPGSVLYNYPHRPSSDEFTHAAKDALSLAGGDHG